MRTSDTLILYLHYWAQKVPYFLLSSTKGKTQYAWNTPYIRRKSNMSYNLLSIRQSLDYKLNWTIVCHFIKEMANLVVFALHPLLAMTFEFKRSIQSWKSKLRKNSLLSIKIFKRVYDSMYLHMYMQCIHT